MNYIIAINGVPVHFAQNENTATRIANSIANSEVFVSSFDGEYEFFGRYYNKLA